MVADGGQGKKLAADVGLSGGGGGFASELCNFRLPIIQRALLPLAEVRRILRASPTAAGSFLRGTGCCLTGIL